MAPSSSKTGLWSASWRDMMVPKDAKSVYGLEAVARSAARGCEQR